MKKQLILLIITILYSHISTAESDPDNPPFRGVWLTNVCSDALDSYENILKTVNLCSDLNINDIFVVTWNRAETTYPSKVVQSLTGKLISERFVGRDPLKELIYAAHKKGIKVHAWFEFGFSSSYKESDGGIIIRKKPHWASRDINGDIVSKNGFQWMNPFHPEVQEFILNLIKEVVINYDIDGVQGDDRLPALPSSGGYDEFTTELYKSEHDNNAPPENYRDKGWIEWRVSLLTNFQGRIYNEVKRLKKGVIVSTAPSIHPWAKEEYLQDWPEWVKRGYTDLVIPQVYRNSTQAYKETLRAQLKFIAPEKLKMFIPGVLIKVENRVVPDKEMLSEIIKFNREQMLNGESLFYYEGLNYFYDILKKTETK